jgi:hypothetical protein
MAPQSRAGKWKNSTTLSPHLSYRPRSRTAALNGAAYDALIGATVVHWGA